MIISAGNQETFKFSHSIGIGLIDSAINLTRLALFDKPDFLLFIGSAGSYGKYNIFDIVESKTSSNIELSSLENKSYTPIDNVVSLENNPKVIVNSSNYISTDEKLSKEFLDLNIDLENMEFYSVLKIAKEFNIPVKGIFIVTNYTNLNAHNIFLENHQKAMEKLVKYLLEKKYIK